VGLLTARHPGTHLQTAGAYKRVCSGSALGVCAGRAGSHKQRSRPFPISNPTFPLPALWSSCITAGFKCGRQSATLLNWDPTRRRLGLLTSLRTSGTPWPRRQWKSVPRPVLSAVNTHARAHGRPALRNGYACVCGRWCRTHTPPVAAHTVPAMGGPASAGTPGHGRPYSFGSGGSVARSPAR